MKIKYVTFLLVGSLLSCKSAFTKESKWDYNKKDSSQSSEKKEKSNKEVSQSDIQEEILEGFPGVNDLFAQLSHVQEVLSLSKESYKRQSKYIDSLNDDFGKRKKLREETYECVLAKYNSFKKALDLCSSNRKEIVRDIELDKRILEGQIQDLKKCTDLEIVTLEKQVENLGVQIDRIKKDYASISHMSKDNVDAAIKELEEIKEQYNDMIIMRTDFLRSFDTLLRELEKAEVSEKNDTLYMKNEVCDS